MKDLYSFDANEECALATYDLVTEAYNNIFETIGIPFVRGTYVCKLILLNLLVENNIRVFFKYH